MTFSTHRITAAFVASIAFTASGAFAQTAPNSGGTGGSSMQPPLMQQGTTSGSTNNMPGSQTGTGATTGNTGTNTTGNSSNSGNSGSSTETGTLGTQGNMGSSGNTGMGTSNSGANRTNMAATQLAPRADRN